MITTKVSNIPTKSSSLKPPRRRNQSFLWFLPPSHSPLHKSCRVFSSVEEKKRDPSSGNGERFQEEEVDECDEDGDEEERKVHCEVDIISWRERRIRATLLVLADIESVWNALTDYERLADFIPNLTCSGRIPCPHPGRIWLEQRGLQRALYWHIEARVVLDLQEVPNADNGRELLFSMVDGDFVKFEGKWSLMPGIRSSTTTLSYELNVRPRFNFPAIFLERIIRSDLPVNLQALARRAERYSEANEKALVTTSVASSRSANTNFADALSEVDKVPHDELKNQNIVESVPLSPSPNELNTNWGIYGKVCRLDRPCVVDEVHFRRYDGLLENGGVHRCVVASITVKAPVPEVWNILTDYETLPEIVPNLAICKILSRENNKVRILQEGCKGLLYMVLHARVVLDLCEKLEEEITFEQVEGDFDSFQGRWVLEQLGNHHTVLKYIVESKMHKDSFLSEAIVEEVIYEDLPSNLCAIRDFIEKRNAPAPSEMSENIENLKIGGTPNGSEMDVGRRTATEQTHAFSSPSPSRKRPRVPGLQRDIEVLKSEVLTFISKNGQEGFMPMRKQLRLHGRVDIEKAITRMGGFRKIASLMNLALAYKDRKPKGYWDSLENLKEEISRFQRNWGMDPAYMPSRKSFERAGRFDIARAFEKWGGLHEVSRLLSLKVRHPSRQPNLAKEKKDDSLDSNDDSEGHDEKMGLKPCVSQDTQKWLQKLKHLDANWMD